MQNNVSALFNVESISNESSVAIKSLIDYLRKDLRALESLGEPVQHWDTLLINIVPRKIDHRTIVRGRSLKVGWTKIARSGSLAHLLRMFYVIEPI